MSPFRHRPVIEAPDRLMVTDPLAAGPAERHMGMGMTPLKMN